MLRSTCWSLVSVSMAVISFIMHRDISANIFLGSLFIIQALKPVEEVRLNQPAMTICAIFGTAVAAYSLLALALGLEWRHPSSW